MSIPSEIDESRTFQLLQQAEARRLSVEKLVQLQIAKAGISGKEASILVADDSDALRDIICMTLRALGYLDLTEAVDGRMVMELLQKRDFDLVILDIDMPRMNGYEVLTAMKKDPARSHIPVIVASGIDQLDAVVRCVELGAEDFFAKPVNSVLLGARIAASLDRKRLRDLDRIRLIELEHEKQLLEIEREKSERLLLNILPVAIADRLKQGERTIAQRYAQVTVLFADLVEFINLSNHTDPEGLVSLLNDLFSRFDRIADVHGLEKIKTIGDSYLVVGGLPDTRPNHAEAVAEMSLEMLVALEELNRDRGINLGIRIGLNSGPVVAGVIGRKKFTYDLWGATVNVAHRMQSSGLRNRIQVTAHTADLLRDKFRFTDRGTVDCKGLGQVSTCLLDGRISVIERVIGPDLKSESHPT